MIVVHKLILSEDLYYYHQPSALPFPTFPFFIHITTGSKSVTLLLFDLPSQNRTKTTRTHHFQFQHKIFINHRYQRV